jgi:hypothetical protein
MDVMLIGVIRRHSAYIAQALTRSRDGDVPKRLLSGCLTLLAERCCLILGKSRLLLIKFMKYYNRLRKGRGIDEVREAGEGDCMTTVPDGLRPPPQLGDNSVIMQSE